MDKRQKSLFGGEPREPDPWTLDDEADRLVATVVLAAPPYGPLDYLVPETMRTQIKVGARVRVPLGRGNRKVVGYCVRLGAPAADPQQRKYAIKEIASLLDEVPLLSPPMLRLTEWMSQYYFCAWGPVVEAVLPSGVRVQAGSRPVKFFSLPTRVAARLTRLKLPEKQARVMRCLATSPEPLTIPQLCQQAQCTIGPIRALQAKGLLNVEIRRVYQGADERPPATADQPPRLNPSQQAGLETILTALAQRRHQSILIFGVTGSGKTEIYMRAIEEVLGFRKQAIVLVPEISLTPQTESRFRARFERVTVLHSHLSHVERHGHWRRISSGEVDVVVGARSAVFAPTPQLGLIVLDEEHDASFKQDLLPRYHAREVALFRGAAERIPVVLGSATPSLESWQAAHEGRFQLVELPHRVLDRPLPQVKVVDLRTEHANRFQRGAISRPLQQAMQAELTAGGQIILLLNRRGYSTSIQCPACGSVVKCPDCEIALTHHRDGEKAICHFCDYQIRPPAECPHCRFEGIRYSGLGTQRLEAEVRARFPDVTCLRMDSDTMRKPGSHERALQRFRAGEARILLGTQMIAKGLDFPDVTLVGVVNADTALHFPDFRAAERTFQLVTQVAGRTGRGDRGGRVLVQTFSPEHPAIEAAVRHDYRAFAKQEWQDRKDFRYPPATSMARVIVRGPDESVTAEAAAELARRLTQYFDSYSGEARLLGPAPAPRAKLRGKYRFHLLLVADQNDALRAALAQATADLKLQEDVQWVVDIDPLDML